MNTQWGQTFYESPFRYAHIINNILRLNECYKISRGNRKDIQVPIWSYDCEKVNLLLPIFYTIFNNVYALIYD